MFRVSKMWGRRSFSVVCRFRRPLKSDGLRYASLFLIVTATLVAQEFWPGATYDPHIPTFRQVLGYEPGERITSHAGIVRYLEALAAASPRIKIFAYGESWEGRKLVYAAISSETNIKKLAGIRSSLERFADPRQTSEGDAIKLAATLPATVWLSYGVHGDEISSPEAALLTAYHLLAARHDAMADTILANDIVLLDPIQNPDGRDRFISYYEQTRGPEPDPNPLAAEHNQPWPTGRFNHYLFDLNRDWIALTQPEIREQVQALRQWLPLVYVDLHEMGGDSTYFFSPEADPYNPNLTAAQRQGVTLFGRNNARWFDHYGFDYFTREGYDAFYAGYGSSWPAYYGGISMTYEQASARGLVRNRTDGTALSFRETIRHHFVASLATLETAAANRVKLLGDFYRYRATAIQEGEREAVREYILPRRPDASATDKLVAILLEHGIEVKRATAPFRANGREYPAGTYAVSLAQPAKRLIRTLLDPETALDEQFKAAEEARRKRRQPSEIPDVTAWSLPLMFHIEAIASSQVSKGSFEAAGADPRPGPVYNSPAALAYLVPWGSQAAARLMASALRQGLRIHTAERAFAQDGRNYSAGTLIFKLNGNPADLSQKLAQLAHDSGADVYGTNSGWVEEGINLGSRYVLPVRRPAIAMAWDEPAQPAAAGATRFVLERQYGYPVTPVRTAQLASADLAQFNVVILPPGEDYADWLGEGGIERLKSWVKAGGTLIALGEAVDFLTDPEVALLDTAQETALGASDEKTQDPPEVPLNERKRVPASEIADDSQYEQATSVTTERPDQAPGAIVRARVESGHWLTAGVGESVNAMVAGRTIYAPIKADKGVNAVYFEAAGQLLASGYLWDQNRRQMAYKPLVIAQPSGRGAVVAFTANPNFRGMLDGMNLLFLNAVFRGPAHAAVATAQ
ncbi:MAG TPA: M14 family metallopeptidase [Bryobacteraceae bacterium]|nr:M14 family metallopeptidase [Bryobacteraceae bacterium]